MNARAILVGIVFTLGLSATSAWAQFGTIRGRVVDEKKQPVAEAEVIIELQGDMAKKLTTKTNKKGDFIQVGLPRGQYKVTVSKTGYAQVAGPTAVGSGDTTEMGDILLPPASAAAGAPGGKGGKNQSPEFNKAVEAYHAGNLDEAETHFKEFLVKSPTSAMGHYNLGRVYFDKTDYANAETFYKKAIELDPDMEEPYTALVEVYQRTGKKADATELLVKTVAAQPTNGLAHYNLGVMYINGQKNAEAYEALKKAAEVMPDHVEVHYLLGTTALNLGDTPGSVKHLEKYLSLSPTNAQNVETAKGLIAALKK